MTYDGSISGGFELVTPVYNLFSSKTLPRLSKLEKFIDVPDVRNCGGHIGFSHLDMSGHELFDKMSGWFPLIFSMYKYRINNGYCKADRTKELKKCYDRYLAIRILDRYIEFRLIASVKDMANLEFRLKLFRVIAKNLNAKFKDVISMAINENHELGSLLRNNVYGDFSKFARLIKDALYFDRVFSDNPEAVTEVPQHFLMDYKDRAVTVSGCKIPLNDPCEDIEPLGDSEDIRETEEVIAAYPY